MVFATKSVGICPRAKFSDSMKEKNNGAGESATTEHKGRKL
jgi:hypothetical protein